MVLHKDRVVEIRSISAVRTTTLCGRMNKRSWDGMNIADTDAEVTCKFCLKLMGR
jgi:hypothetical protein